MKTTLPRMVFGLAWVMVGVTLLHSLLWLSIVVDHDGRGGVALRSLFGPVLGLALLLLVVIPSGVFFLRWRQRRDWWSLVLSGACLLGTLGEMVALFFVPLHGPW
ncbi:MAG TPA: hypothetical protein VNZ22_21595 [Bacillota bacterium]|nr:hypothetical protein [Bacillota bacterium]